MRRVQVKRISKFQQLAQARTRSLIMDVEAERGGEDVGFRPLELWLMSLSSCSVYTMIRGADEMGYQIDNIQVSAEDKQNAEGHIIGVTFNVKVTGDISAEQKNVLFDYVRNNCKLFRTVNDNISIEYVEAPNDTQTADCTLDGGNCCV